MKKITLSIIYIFTVILHLSAQVGIGTSSPDGSARLHVSSNNKGLLMPRMTAAERNAITSPANGLIVYQTDGIQGFYYNVGTAGSPNWVILLNGTDALPAISGTNLTNLNASNLTTGTVSTARLGSGTASTSTYLRGDGTWAAVASSYPDVINAEAVIPSTEVFTGTFTELQSITIPSTGKYLITCFLKSSTANDIYVGNIKQGTNILASNTGYSGENSFITISHVLNLTTTTNLIIEGKYIDWGSSTNHYLEGTYSLVKLAD